MYGSLSYKTYNVFHSNDDLDPDNSLNHIHLTNEPIEGIFTLKVSKAINCYGDIHACGGPLKTVGDPDAQWGICGGGALQLGWGYQWAYDPPRINLLDEGYHILCVTAGDTSEYVTIDSVLADMKVRNLVLKGLKTASPSPYYDKGAAGQILVSQGPGLPPAWMYRWG